GRMLTGELKQILIDKLNEFLEAHRGKRDEAQKLINDFKHDGTLAQEMWKKIHE
ncbi:MAG: tryptophan--tRNA ligase, partial [Thermoprotei archaeon]